MVHDDDTDTDSTQILFLQLIALLQLHVDMVLRMDSTV